MGEDGKPSFQAAKWVVGVATICILIYLGLQNCGAVAMALKQVLAVMNPLVVGGFIALILNVPMCFIEEKILFGMKEGLWRKVKRPAAIIFVVLFVVGIFIGTAVLVVPELVNALKLIFQIAVRSLERLAEMEKEAGSGVNWSEMKIRLENWVSEQRSGMMDYLVGIAGMATRTVITFFLDIVFAIYILLQKEKLGAQIKRLIQAWLSPKWGENLLHIAETYSKSFKSFIAGQAIEAVILGVLCMIGMFFLRIPYVPMVGTLIGVTALIPLVGAYVGIVVGGVIILTANPVKAVVFVMFIIILQQIEGNFIYPRTVGAKIKLPALWVLAAVIVGGNIAGALGMLLGVPITSATYALLKEATQRKEEKMS